MVAANLENELYFNTRRAVGELLAGKSPVEVFKHPKFPEGPLPVITEKNLGQNRVTGNSDIKKAMIGTLQVAAVADMAHEFRGYQPRRIPDVMPYELDSPTTIQLIDMVFLQQFFSTVVPTLQLTILRFGYGGIPSPVFDKTFQALAGFITPDEYTTKKKTQEKIRANSGTVSLVAPVYSHLLRAVFEQRMGITPDVGQFATMVRNSSDILDLMAARNIKFTNASTETFIDPNKPYEERMDPDNFDLLIPPLYNLAVRIKPNTRPTIERVYREKSAKSLLRKKTVFVTTGCPAASGLIGLLMDKYASNIEANAKQT